MRRERFTILLVDDSEFNRVALSMYLEDEGYLVIQAAGGLEAILAVDQDPVDLVLLDVMMPGMSGIEVLQTLRQHHPPQSLPVIMVTAKDGSDDMVEAFDHGANDYVTKPLDFPVVLARVRAQLRARTPASSGRPRHAGPAEGSVLDGKYRLDSLIGQGNYGSVYRGTHLKLQRPVAVKLLLSGMTSQAGAMARFEREAVALSRLEHPNAVSVLDYSLTSDGVAFLVMELLEGQTLEDALFESRQLGLQRLIEVALPVCEVLDAAHGIGIIHRDIKPQNVFLHRSPRGESVKVLDFGIVKLVGEAVVAEKLTLENCAVGTPSYMAPERFQGQTYDGRADVYSLGVMLYEMLVGVLPFPASGQDAISSTIAQHLHDDPKPPRSVFSTIPAEIDSLILKMLAKQQEERPSAREVAQALSLFSDGPANEVDLPQQVVGEASGETLIGSGREMATTVVMEHPESAEVKPRRSSD